MDIVGQFLLCDHKKNQSTYLIRKNSQRIDDVLALNRFMAVSAIRPDSGDYISAPRIYSHAVSVRNVDALEHIFLIML